MLFTAMKSMALQQFRLCIVFKTFFTWKSLKINSNQRCQNENAWFSHLGNSKSSRSF